MIKVHLLCIFADGNDDESIIIMVIKLINQLDSASPSTSSCGDTVQGNYYYELIEQLKTQRLQDYVKSQSFPLIIPLPTNRCPAAAAGLNRQVVLLSDAGSRNRSVVAIRSFCLTK